MEREVEKVDGWMNGLEETVAYLARCTPIIGEIVCARESKDENLWHEQEEVEERREGFFRKHGKFLLPIAVSILAGLSVYTFSDILAPRARKVYYSRDGHCLNGEDKFVFKFFRVVGDERKAYCVSVDIEDKPRVIERSLLVSDERRLTEITARCSGILPMVKVEPTCKRSKVGYGTRDYDALRELMMGCWKEREDLRKYFPPEFVPKN